MTDGVDQSALDALADDELRRRWTTGTLTDGVRAAIATQALGRGVEFPSYVSREIAARPLEEYHGDFEILARGLAVAEAELLCGFLRVHDIPAQTGDTNIMRYNWFWAIAVGGAKVRVPAEFVEHARALMVARARGEFALDESFDPGAPQEGPEVTL